MGFLSSSDDKESACNAGDPGSTPGLGRSPGEGIGYLLQYSWASLVAQTVKSHTKKEFYFLKFSNVYLFASFSKCPMYI